MAKSVVIYGNGWLGNLLAKEYDARIEDNDINIAKAAEEDIWINTAAKTPIDWCEYHKVETFYANVLGSLRLAQQAKRNGKKYVFISSACIFESEDENDVKDESSRPNPSCFYTETKVMAERLIQEVNPDALIVRIRLPIHSKPHPRNTIDKLLSYPKINDNQETITIIDDMIPALKENLDKKGVIHLVNEGTISPAEIAEQAKHTFDIWSKEDQDKQLESEGKPHRVTTYVTSTEVPLLPNVRERVPEIIKQYEVESGSRKHS